MDVMSTYVLLFLFEDWITCYIQLYTLLFKKIKYFIICSLSSLGYSALELQQAVYFTCLFLLSPPKNKPPDDAGFDLFCSLLLPQSQEP